MPLRSHSDYVRPAGWMFLTASIAVSIMALPAFVSNLKDVLAESASTGVDERLTNLEPKSEAWLLEQHGGRWGQHGWYLGGGEEGNLRIRFPGTEPGLLRLRLWLFSPGYLSVSVRQGTRREAIPLSHLDGRVLKFHVNGPLELLVESSSNLREEQMVLDRYAAAWFPLGSELPSLTYVAACLALFYGGWACTFLHRQFTPATSITILGAGGILLAVVIGFNLRWALFDIARGLPADPDAGVGGYFTHATNFSWLSPNYGFYSGNFNGREPLHVAALSTWLHLWGRNPQAVRLYTVLLSVLVVLGSGIFIWRLSGRPVLGVAASWILAISPAWVDESVRGLRLETISLLLLAVLSAWLWANGWLGAILLGMISGLMALVQSTAISIVLPLIWIGWLINMYRDRRHHSKLSPAQWRWFHIGTASLVAALLYVPHLYGLFVVHGDPSWPSYGYARWNANIEFPQRLGTDGFPSREEFEKDTYAGPPLTYGQYVFGLHTISQLVYGQLKGWVESIVYMSVSSTPRLKSLLFLEQASGFSAMYRHISVATVMVLAVSLFLTVIGWVDLWHRAEYWWVPFLSLWGVWYAAFLYSVRVIEPFRHTAHVYPLLLFCLLWGGSQFANRLKNLSLRS